MEKRIYRVLVTWNDGADVLIEAESEKEATERVVKLMESGSGRYELDQWDAPDYIAADVELIYHPNADEQKVAATNAEAWDEYEELVKA